MAGYFNIGRTRVESKSAMIGGAIAFGLACVPTIGDFITGNLIRARTWVFEKFGRKAV